MAAITYDGQSFMIDGRRVWLVSGTIHYARTPRASWSERIASAKLAGLNAIEIPVIWARHEPRQGHFDFQGENDLRHFVQLCQKAGMYVWLRAGPYVEAGWDMGGMPPWLLGLAQAQGGIKLRSNQSAFLDACSRYITALAGQLRDLQVTSPAKGGAGGGPILLLQSECDWRCGDDLIAGNYLQEIDRYFREAGFSVPMVNSNDLWQSVEGQIDGWTGFDGMLSHLRQLQSIRPTAPKLVARMQVGQRAVWGQAAPKQPSPETIAARLAEVLAAGGQFNLDPFFGGTNLGFSGGREASHAEAFLCTSFDHGAPLSETGLPGPAFHAVRRVCTFASRFSRLLSHLEPARQAVALMPPGGETKASHPSVIHLTGAQGDVAFVFGPAAADGHAGKHAPLQLLLTDGSTLPVELGDQSTAWCLINTRLSGRGHLDYCNLSAFAVVGKVFVCFGPAGSRGLLSINGSPLEVTVPGGATALVHEHEGVTVVIASTEQIKTIALDDVSVYIGVDGFDQSGHPIAHGDGKQYTRIDAEGQVKVHKVAHAPHHGKAAGSRHRTHLDEWSAASVADFTSGTSARFASITKPGDLVSLGAAYGYGWYRVKFSCSGPHKYKVMFPQAGHRLHLTLDGEPAGVVGLGPGAEELGTLQVKKGSHSLVVLAENMGRVSGGSDLGEQTGLWGHGWCVEPLSAGKPKLVASEPVDVLNFRAPLWRVHRDDMTDPRRLTWTIQHRRKTPVMMRIAPFETRSNGGIVLLDGKPIAYFPAGGAKTLMFDPEQLGRGKNDIQITLLGSTEAEAAELGKAVTFLEGVENLTAKAEWAFAKWQMPGDDAFKKPGKHVHGDPLWWRCTFTVDDGDGPTPPPVFLDCTGLSKGQIYVNGQHVGRYFTATATGKRVPPQHKYLIPRSMLNAGGSNELTIFDEHGLTPSKVRLVVSAKETALD